MSSIGVIQGSNLLLPLTKKNARVARKVKVVRFDSLVSEIYSEDEESRKSLDSPSDFKGEKNGFETLNYNI